MEKHKLALAVPVEWLRKWLNDLASMRLAGGLRYFRFRQGALEQLARRANLVQLMRCQDALIKLAPLGSIR